MKEDKEAHEKIRLHSSINHGRIKPCGHGDRVLVADGNFPMDSKCPDAKKVYLGLCSGMPTVTDVLQTLLQEICVESATVMLPEDNSRPPIYDEFEKVLPGIQLETLERYSFYDAEGKENVRLAILTGEKRTYSNLIITIDVA